MNRNISVLWIDDDKAYVDSKRYILKDILKKSNITTEIYHYDRGIGVTEIIHEKNIDFILLDIDFGKKKKGEENFKYINGFQILEKIEEQGFGMPVILVSIHVPSKDETNTEIKFSFQEQIKQYKNKYLAAFNKSNNDFNSIIEFIVEYFNKPPIKIVLLSDLHVGTIEKKDNARDNFIKDIENEFSFIQKRYKPNYLCITGDFAWKKPVDDLNFAVHFLNRARIALKLEKRGCLQFCPGNHDFIMNTDKPWNAFHNFILKLSEFDDSIKQGYSTYNPVTDSFNDFSRQSDLLSVSNSAENSILIASLNSISVQKGRKFLPEIGKDQLSLLRRRLNKIGKKENQIRIAIFHHNLFPAPNESINDEGKILRDHAYAIRMLNSLGFNLILHGHSHYSCINSHKLQVFNKIGKRSDNSPKEMIVLSSGTFGGEPNRSAPVRQYSILNIGYWDANNLERSFRLSTRIYNPEHDNWTDGENISIGEYSIR